MSAFVRVMAVCAICACGGETKTAAPTNRTAVKVAPRQITTELFCERFAALKSSGCEMFEKLDIDHDACVKQLADPAMAQFRATFGPCFVNSNDCQAVADCVTAAAAPKLNDLRTCDNHDADRAVGMPPADWANRKGANVKKFSDAKSAKAQPIEVCGITSENQWLVGTTCDDGSHPYESRADAEIARVGNVGQGGRCGSIIDLYKVKCPEATYEIYLDGYVCPLPK